MTVSDDAHNLRIGENKAYYMTVAVQRWLSVRLDVRQIMPVFYAPGVHSS